MHRTVIGVDLGGTKLHAARIHGRKIEKSFRMKISSHAQKQVVLQEVIQSIKNVMNDDVAAIGIGVPGLVDMENGIIYDMINIPSWDKVPLRAELQAVFNVPVFINNDANCFALGERYFGLGQNYQNIVGLTLGTGMGAGIIIDGKLYCGTNCGAGEFGMLPYLDKNYEYYCSGQFFKHVYQTEGSRLFEQARKNDPQALNIFSEFGKHLGHALIAIFYALDPQIIILGGSVSQSYRYFAPSMKNVLQEVAFQNAINKMKIEVSRLSDIAVLGAASLTFGQTLEDEAANKTAVLEQREEV